MQENTFNSRVRLPRRRLGHALAAFVLLAATPASAYDVTISSVASSGGSWSGGNGNVWTATASGSNVSISDIKSRIALGDVIINADNAGAEEGDLSVESPLDWNADTTLTLSAYRTITIKANLTATGTMAGLILNSNSSGNGGELSILATITLSGSASTITINGTPYTVIRDVAALQAMNNDLSGNYALGADIDATATIGWNSGAGFDPVGDEATPFSGTFLGMHHTISNLVINRPEIDNVGVFGTIGASGALSTVGVTDGSISGGNTTGGLAGYSSGTIDNSYSAIKVSGGSAVGGLVGENAGSITQCFTTGEVSGTELVGSLIGRNTGSVISCNATGTVTDSSNAGGGAYQAGTVYSGASFGLGAQSEQMYLGGFLGGGQGWQGTIAESFSETTSKGVTTISQVQKQMMFTWPSIPDDWGKSLHFEQPGPSSVFMSYLPTEDPAQIFASLTGNGKAFLVTPHGVLFGNTASLGKTDLDALCAAAFAWTKSTSCGSDQAAAASLGLSTDMLVAGGWNLLGNSTDAPLDVAESFGDAALITSVWKRVPQTNTWAFYSPLPADGGAAYAESHGYELLTTINGGEGFWVNAKAPFVFALPLGKLRTTAAAQTAMTPGWNMIALGEVKTPSEFNTLLNQSQPGEVMTTLWAWDNAQANWYFYMPSMETDGTLADYIAGKHYLDFTAANKALGPGLGFWVNAKP